MWQLVGHTILQTRRFRKDVQRIATAEGASDELFEALVIEMMKRGLSAEREAVKALMAELRNDEV